ncbi:unnamed protein product [Sphagnum jensenii]|uniref:Stress response protein NST1 n=2 Tax=Sphagnum jensenii TaxID=128206 RepID=A0ABP1A079_9BRYO
MAFSRVFKPHVLFYGGRGIAGFGSRFLSEGVVESSSVSAVSGESSTSSSGSVAASLVGLRAESVGGIDDGMAMEVEKEEEKSIGRSSSSSSSVFRKGSGTVVGRSLALYRREYDRQIAELRKKYAAEQERKKREEMQVKKLERERIMLEKAQRLVIKKQQAEIRAREVEEEAKALRLTLEKQREQKAAYRQWKEKRLVRIRAREKESIRQQSSSWIEEKDLERRIVDALVDPFYLSGSWAASPDRDMGIDEDSDDE